jgi:hypothetical protein
MYRATPAVNLNAVDLIKSTDRRVLDLLVNLHTAINKDKLDLRELDSIFKAMQHMQEDAKEYYINSLLYPEISMGCKLPTLFPIPSSAFQMHFVASGIPSNASGHLGWTWNPFFLQDAGAAVQLSTFFVDNNAGYTSNAPDPNFNSTLIAYNQIPVGVYGSYRVVSASLVVSYVGRMDIVSGTIGMGIGLNNSGVAPPLGAGIPDPQSSIFAISAQVDNMYFRERTQAANGLRGIYFPIDDKYTYFLPINTLAGPGATLSNCYNSGFYFAGYAVSLPASTVSLRFDMYVNYEAMVIPGFNNFIPTTPGNSSNIDVMQTAANVLNENKMKVLHAGSDTADITTNIGSVGVLRSLSENEQFPGIAEINRVFNKTF